ncbi:MAG: aconitate hydratase [Deltaproteobacteria bacterium]|jgi:aconitate hydratase|nr:aconitate hydratase [Deltaproteobacteria bacterium]
MSQLNLTQKIIHKHLAEGRMIPGTEIGLTIDQTLVHDATGQMALLQFEALGFPRTKARRSLVYTDHNILQTGYENADDHAFLASAAKKFGLFYSKAGNGICHQVNLESFSRPGDTLLGADSHTTTGGAVGELAIGAGGLDVAAAMGGLPFYLPMPEVIGIELTGSFNYMVRAKDLALEVLRLLGVSGGRGCILEFYGPALASLSVTERAVPANMSIETGAVTAVFPSDDQTLDFLTRQGRAGDFTPLAADPEAEYSRRLKIDLSLLEPLAACPHSPGNVQTVRSLAGTRIDQVAIGSCTNSSLADLLTAAAILKGRKIPPEISLAVAPGSRQVYWELASRGALADLLAAGARIMESACGFCNGVGQAPKTNGISLRTSNRNFPGRSGTASASLYLVSPETAAISAVNGFLTDPREVKTPLDLRLPEQFSQDMSLVVPPAPASEASEIEIVRGPNIAPLPRFAELPRAIDGEVMLSLGDNVTTDDILPAGAHILALRSNIPAISRYIFSNIDPSYPERQKKGPGFIAAGLNYGQGSSREHAALAPRYLGLAGVIARSFARIHKANLCNFGILPLELSEAGDLELLKKGCRLHLDLAGPLSPGCVLALRLPDADQTVPVKLDVSQRQLEMLQAGGLLALAARNKQASK